MKNDNPILYTEAQWRNSPLSIARHYGKVMIGGEEYVICNKHGISLLELSNPRSPHYVPEDKAIPPGEPADLVMAKWLPVYRDEGRDMFLEIIKNGVTLKSALASIKETSSPKKEKIDNQTKLEL